MRNKLIKLISVLLMIPLTFSAVGCGQTPVRPDSLEIIAYSTPTNANWDGNSNNPEGLTDKVFSDMAAAGFTGLQPLREGVGGSTLEQAHEKANADALKAMALCEKYGMHYMVRDWTFLGGFAINSSAGNHKQNWLNYFADGGTIESGLEEMFALASTQQVVNHPNYAGHHLWDEPTIQEMEQLVPVVKKYKELVPHGDSFFNLLPCYANSQQLGTSNYYEYVDYYCKNIGSQLGYVCYDYYPYKDGSYNSSMDSMYLYNFEMVAKLAKQYNLNFRMYIQANRAFGQSSRDVEGTYDLLQQMYCAMAYGCTYFIYFVYGYGNSDADYVDTNLNPTQKYQYAKEANQEILKLEDVILDFYWEKTLVKDDNPDTDMWNQAFNWVENPQDTHKRIKDWTVTKDTIAGCFKDAEGRDGFLFVNYEDPGQLISRRTGLPSGKDISSDVTVTFKNTKSMIVYEHGEQKIVQGDTYTFKLGAGEGQFVIPLN